MLILLPCAGSILATPLQSYREAVRLAVIVLETLPQWKKVEDQDEYARRVTAAIQQVRETVVSVERVEWNNTTLSVDNKWLAEALIRYERIPSSDTAGREAELTRVEERLKALGERLAELDGRAELDAASREAEKKKLDAILQRPEYGDKQDEDSALARLWKEFLEWLRNLFPKSVEMEPGTSRAVSGVSQVVVAGLALAVIAYVLWKFTPLFRRRHAVAKRKARRSARIVLGERLEPDQTSADLLAEAEALARSGDLRAAIRKGYIALLCELSDRKIIGLAEHKTNRDYLRAVSQMEPLHNQMQQLTRSFENHWYGLVPATENDWNAFRSGFQKAVTSDK